MPVSSLILIHFTLLPSLFSSQAQKGIAALEPDPCMAAQVMVMQKVISQNGVPAMEIGRVLADGADSKELFNHLADAAEAGISAPEFKGTDVEPFVKAYENLGLKNNRRDDIIEHIDRDLIQVSCSVLTDCYCTDTNITNTKLMTK